MRNIHKVFGKVSVLNGVDLQLERGQLLGLVGENGAGKSTLMNILGGLFVPTEGTMTLDENLFAPTSPNEALQAGIAFVHQELNLFPNLSVMENLFISGFPKKRFLGLSLIDQKSAREKAKELLSIVGLNVSEKVKVGQLTAAQQQLLEITKILSRSPRIIIFDEPTTSLTRHEAEKLFQLIERLQSEGIGIIYISHNLEDVMSLADEIMVLRDGNCVRQENQNAFTLPKLIKDMVGRDLETYFPQRDVTPLREKCLEVSQVGAEVVHDVSFSIRKKEVLGLYGLVGAGRSEMARLLYGLDVMQKGTIHWNGQKIQQPSPEKWVQEGVAFLTENRREEGLMIQQSIARNIQLAGLPNYTTPLQTVRFRDLDSDVEQQARANKIKYNNLKDQSVATLSGGNQQKTVLAKWLMIAPKLLILDEPTKGIDIGARHDIYSLVNDLVKKGSSILLISSEIEELIGLCDRILVMGEGRIRDEFHKAAFDRSAILEAALHGKENQTLAT